jgi:PLP dependent protein
LQSNKTRLVAEHFAWVHSIDRLKLAERLSAQRPDGICRHCRSACRSTCPARPARVVASRPTAGLCAAVAALPGLRLRGLMTIPEPADDESRSAAPFRQPARASRAHACRRACARHLSMGMSHDLEAAVAEGATIVRIGTAIFGERNYA